MNASATASTASIMFVRLLSALRALGVLIAWSGLSACSLAPVITHNSLDYNGTIEDVSNQSLVTNVLRGRDNAPLYFPDLSQIRGAVTATASAQASLPYGPTFGTVQPGPLSVSSAPTFDIAPTNTKKFYQGILNPISKDIFAYYIERDKAASDFQPTFNLLVNAIEDTNTRTIIPWYDDDFARLSASWFAGDDASPVVVRAGDASSDLGPPVKADAKAIIDANSAGLIIRSKGGMIQLGKKASKSTVCFRGAGGSYFPVSFEENSIVKSPSDAKGADSGGSSSTTGACNRLNGKRKVGVETTPRYKLHLRSVEQMFYFLGAVVKDEQRSAPKFALPKGVPLAGCPRVPFYIRTNSEGARFAVSYRGQTYYIANDGTPALCGAGQDHDRTLPMLAVLNDLLNLSRDADEVPTTRAVQAVGTN